MSVRTIVLSVLAAVGLAGASQADVWDAAGFESEPAAGDPVSQGDDEIRLMRKEVRFRGEVEHHWGPASDADDNGLHRLGSARCFHQTAAPTTIAVADYNNALGTSASGTANLVDTATNAAITVGIGRCWVDTDGLDGVAGNGDDNTLNFYSGTAWVPQASSAGAGLINAGAHNLIYAGSFDAQVSTSVTVADGWTNVNTADIAYVTTAVSEGVGLAMRTTANGGNNEGASQTLAGLKASTVYRAVARVRKTAGGTSCSLRTTGGTVNVADTTTGDTTYETLEGTFTTDATPTAIVVIIESDVVADVCAWDHVGVYELSPAAIPQPGIIRARASRAAGAGALGCAATYAAGCLAVDSGLEVFVTPPGPGYLIMLDAHVNVDTFGAAVGCMARLTNAAGPVVLDETISTLDASANNALEIVLPLHATVLNPTPGTQINFEVDVRGISAVTDCDLEDVVVSWIEAIMIPSR